MDMTDRLAQSFRTIGLLAPCIALTGFALSEAGVHENAVVAVTIVVATLGAYVVDLRYSDIVTLRAKTFSKIIRWTLGAKRARAIRLAPKAYLGRPVFLPGQGLAQFTEILRLNSAIEYERLGYDPENWFHFRGPHATTVVIPETLLPSEGVRPPLTRKQARRALAILKTWTKRTRFIQQLELHGSSGSSADFQAALAYPKSADEILSYLITSAHEIRVRNAGESSSWIEQQQRTFNSVLDDFKTEISYALGVPAAEAQDKILDAIQLTEHSSRHTTAG